jgi:hypothetical protein
MKALYIKHKLPLWIFSINLIILFYFGFVYPSETDFWLVRYGYSIYWLEVGSIMASLCILSPYLFEDEGKIGKLKGKIFGWTGLIMFTTAAFFITYQLNLLLFPYFLISTGIKCYIFTYKKSENEKWEGLKDWGLTFIIFISASFIANILTYNVLSSFFNNVFSQQIQLISQFEEELIITMQESLTFVSSDVSNVIYMFLWGIIYYVMIIIVDVLLIYRKHKSNLKKKIN